MDARDLALLAAGVIGAGVAVIHGVLTERLMVRATADAFASSGPVSPVIRRLIPVLLHYSTASWFAGGLALIAAAFWFDPSARLATGLCVGALYLYGAAGNLWGTRRLHPGWMLYAAALVLIAHGVGVIG